MASDQPSRSEPPADILVVEDERAVAQLIKRCMLGLGYLVSGVAASASAALEALEQHQPSLVIMDIGLEGPTDGVELATQIRARWGVPIVYVTGQDEGETMRRLIRTGPYGFVRKPFDEMQLSGAVEVALFRAAEERGREQELERTRRRGDELAAETARLETRFRQIAEVIGADLPSAIGERLAPSQDVAARLADLSPRELEVLSLLREGRRVTSIAKALSVSPFTVRNHLRALFRKLDVHSQDELLELLRGVSSAAIGSIRTKSGRK